MNAAFCTDLFSYKRFITREVKIGDCPLGGNNPIRIQSMTTTDTMDTVGTVKQTIELIEAGCDYVRITAPSLKEAQNLAEIKKQVKAAGFNTPLIADIHFTPNAAELAARLIEKVRVNPGNYADKKKFDIINYDDVTYEAEINRIRDRFLPLVKVCKEYGTAMRIGTNHGSLSDRILSRYGDTPIGMVESAFEFLRICENENYHNIVLSMKASNVKIMVEAYRLLIAKFIETGRNYPIHLGVTEAGDGEDGRIKSAAGIGTLLEDGIGDTIRVSLTEDPVYEVPVAKQLVVKYNDYQKADTHVPIVNTANYNPYEFNRRETTTINNIGSNQVPRVIADFSYKKNITQASLFAVGYNYSVSLDKYNLTDMACDYVYVGSQSISFEIPGTLGIIQDYNTWLNHKQSPRHYALLNLNEFKNTLPNIPNELHFLTVSTEEITPEILEIFKTCKNTTLVLKTKKINSACAMRSALLTLKNNNIKLPVIIQKNYVNDWDTLQLYASTDFAALFIDGLGDGIFISAHYIADIEINKLSFGILQATRSRISKTEYISCPSCGRTLFDLQETTQKIRKVTGHLKGVKIGIMGCIVNGPGEMADADYGYVGTGVDKISLYKGKEVVRKNIHPEFAVNELIELIKEHGDWVEIPN